MSTQIDTPAVGRRPRRVLIFTDDQLLELLRSMVVDGRVPTRRAWDSQAGLPHSSTMVTRLGGGAGWAGVAERVGARPSWERGRLSRDDAIALVWDFVEEYGRLPVVTDRFGARAVTSWRLVAALGAERWSQALRSALTGHPSIGLVKDLPANGIRYDDAQLREALREFAAQHSGTLTSAAWTAWSTQRRGRPRYEVIRRRLTPAEVSTITGLAVDSRVERRRELVDLRQGARSTLRQLADLLGRTPLRIELDRGRQRTHPNPAVRQAAGRDGCDWLVAEQILDAYGSWRSAIDDAGLERMEPREEILLALVDYRERFGIWPRRADLAMDRARRSPSSYALRAERRALWGGPGDERIMRYFGSVAAAVRSAHELRPDLPLQEAQQRHPGTRRRKGSRETGGLGRKQLEVLRCALDSPSLTTADLNERFGRTTAARLLRGLVERELVDVIEVAPIVSVRPEASDAVRAALDAAASS